RLSPQLNLPRSGLFSVCGSPEVRHGCNPSFFKCCSSGQAWGHTSPVAAASASAAPRKRGRPGLALTAGRVIVDGKKLRCCWELRKDRKVFHYSACARIPGTLQHPLQPSPLSLIARSGGL